MLARLVDVRRTRDTDLFYSGTNIDEAVEELSELAGVELGDFLVYRLNSVETIIEEQGYRSGRRLRFVPVLGGVREIQPPVVIDLVVDPMVDITPDVIVPTNVLKVKGLEAPPYRAFPIVNCIADKVIATVLPYPNGSPSSRVKDLVDLVVYLRGERIEGSALHRAIREEFRLRHEEMPETSAFLLLGTRSCSAAIESLPKRRDCPRSIWRWCELRGWCRAA